MKRKHIILVMLLVFSGIFTMQSCKKEDNVSPEIKQAFTTPTMTTAPAAQADGIVLYSGTTVDLVWTSTNPGAAQSWQVYFGTTNPPPLYQENVTTQKVTVPVEDGQTYYWQVIIVDARGIKTTSAISEFVAVSTSNPNPAISIGLTTTTDVLTSIGLDLKPDEVVDLRLLVLKKSDMSIVSIIDNGASSEDYSGLDTLANGDYVLGVDIFSTINAGDFNNPITLSLALQFDQLGFINQKLEFPNVMTNIYPCDLYRTYLATIHKAGAVYTIASDISYFAPTVLTWTGDDATYPSEVTTTASCAGKSMTGLGFGWMLGFWGEIIVDGGELTYTIDGDNITIPMQPYCSTTYNGAPQTPYSIVGSGTIDNSGAFPVYTIHYDFVQAGTYIAQYCFDNGIWPTNYLEAVITTGPGGKAFVSKTPRPINRPIH
jgi:hypothetical protein